MKTSKLLVLFFLVVLSQLKGFSQNCTLSASTNTTICASSALTLNGSATGLYAPGGDASWRQVSGPGTLSITNNTNLTSGVTGFTAAGGTYTLRLEATCLDNSYVYREVTYTVKPITFANAGTNQTHCPSDAGMVLSANTSLLSGEGGNWTKPTDNGITISKATSANSSFTLSTIKSGPCVLNWNITSSNGCASNSNVTIYNEGGVSSVTAGTDMTLGSCYGTTQTSPALAGSYGGTGTGGQAGVWTVVGGPNTPVINSNGTLNTATVSNLIQGSYTLRWTVSGSCVNGSSTVHINVPAPKGPVTNPSVYSPNICDGRTSIILTATTPAYAGEYAQWTWSSGTGTIYTPNSPNTLVTFTGTYKASYSIINPTTGCVGGPVLATINVYATPTITITSSTNMILPVDASSATVSFTSSGGSTFQYAAISTPSGSVAAPVYATAAASSSG